MRVNEITRPETIDDATRYLSRYGYRNAVADPRDEGAYASVYTPPGKPYVVKLFMASDLAYQTYLGLITRFKNPHFPQLRGRPARINNKYWAVRMEMLSPLPFADHQMLYTMQDYIGKLMQHTPRNRAQLAEIDEIFVVEPLFQKFPDLKMALLLIWQYCLRGHTHILDLHKHNVMLRGQVPVITDPTAVADSS